MLRRIGLFTVVAALSVAAVGATIVPVMMSATGCGGSQHGTAEPSIAMATPAVARPVPTEYPLHIPPIPAGFALPPKRPCPDGWQRVSDDVLNYSICIPADWGILDEKTGEPSKDLTDQGHGLKILSADGFPNPVGQSIDRALQDPTRNVIYIATGSASASPNSYIACDAQPRAPLGSLPAVQCQFRFNYSRGDADQRPDGNMVETDMIVVLPDAKSGVGDGVFIAVAGSQRAVQVHADTISQILDTVEGQP